MRIFNAPQDKAQSIVSQHNIQNIISVYSPNNTFPLFPGVKSDQILRLCFNDINRPQNNLKIITMNDIKKIINFVTKKNKGDFLVPCYAGVSRSIALTIIILFILEKNINIDDLVLELEHRAPFASPNKLVLQQAGRALGEEKLFRTIIKNFHIRRNYIRAKEFCIEF